MLINDVNRDEDDPDECPPFARQDFSAHACPDPSSDPAIDPAHIDTTPSEIIDSDLAQTDSDELKSDADIRPIESAAQKSETQDSGDQDNNNQDEEKPVPEKTPFDDEDVIVTKPPVFLGLTLRNPIKTFGDHYDQLSRERKQNLMYVVQCTAACCLLAGGVVGIMTGAPAIFAAGMIATGSLNGIRSAGQYIGRRVFAKSPESSSRTEIKNSFISGMTNAPQAATGSVAGMSAVLSYVLRTMKYAIESEQAEKYAKDLREAKKAKQIEAGDIKNDKVFEDNAVTKSTATFLGPVKRGVKVLSRTFNKTAARAGGLVQKLPGGNKILSDGPGVVMTGRGVLQVAEGAILIGLAGAGAGVPAIVAGALYVGAATVMRNADTEKPSFLRIVKNPDKCSNAEEAAVAANKAANSNEPTGQCDDGSLKIEQARQDEQQAATASQNAVPKLNVG